MFTLHLDATALLESLRSFVGEEFDVQRKKFAEQMALPQNERVESGTCLERLRFIQLDDQGRALFEHPGNDSKLREGDLVRLSQEGTEDACLAWIYREEEKQIWLVRDGSVSFRQTSFAEKSEGWLLDETFIDLEKNYLEALDRVPTSAIGQERIIPLLMGRADTSLDEEEYNGVMADLAEKEAFWEDAQVEAIAGCLAADHCYLVQGPPGTGKTRVLAQIVSQLVRRGERVLITAFTHRAIDNALSATACELEDRERVARFAPAMHRRGENYDLYEFFSESPLAGLNGGWVAGATPFALRKRLSAVEFDTIVIDEAGQMTTPLAIMAMLSGRKYLLFGDQQQLGPIMLSKPRREAQFIGIFHALRLQELHSTTLDVTYRLNDELTRWPSENFYQGKLHAAPSVAVRRLNWVARENTPEVIKAALDPQSPLIWMSFDHQGSRTACLEEAGMAAELLRALFWGGVSQDNMAVVTPYRHQARRIRLRLETLVPDVSWRGCVIDTVERMQGQEREVILLSLCASDPNFVQRQAEFLFDPRRLNVAATRARTKLIILASDSLLHTRTSDTDLEEDVDLFRSLHHCATQISSR